MRFNSSMALKVTSPSFRKTSIIFLPAILKLDIPLLMGYADKPEETIPKAISLCYVTVTVISMLVLMSGAGAVSILDLLRSEAPLMTGIELVYGEGSRISDAVAYLIVLGLIVNFFAFVLFASQQVQTIADAGFLPNLLAYRHPQYGSPINASIASSSAGLFFCVSFSFILDEDTAQNVLLMAALMSAILSYVLVLECIVRIRNIEYRMSETMADNEDYSPKRPVVAAAISDLELLSLGDEPGDLRFFYSSFGARWAQLMCAILVIGLLVLASTSFDYFYGIIVLLLLGSTMFWTISRISSRGNRVDLDALEDEGSGRKYGEGNAESLKRLLGGFGGHFDEDDDDEEDEEVDDTVSGGLHSYRKRIGNRGVPVKGDLPSTAVLAADRLRQPIINPGYQSNSYQSSAWSPPPTSRDRREIQ